MHYLAPPDPPSDDKRWRMVLATMRRHGNRPDALIETLHTVQENFGHLDPEALRYVARSLRVPLSRVYGVATFYHYFSLDPPGDHQCILCTGTACYIKGVPGIVEAMRAEFGLELGETAEDRSLSFKSARCLGACGQAPVAVIDETMVGALTPESTVARIREVMSHGDD
jgi:bidirectional [NiFe] hydrogenase diaphorase subunit